MAYSVRKQAVRILLNNGTDSEGRTRTVSLNFADMSEPNFDPTDSTDQSALLAMLGALEPCLDKTVYAVEAVTTASISA